MLHLVLAVVLSNGVAEMLEDPEIKRELADMVVLASSMKACEGEHAAFVVRRSDGKLAVIRWSTDCQALNKTYRGIVPPNTVAIVHTHPDGRRKPSPQDIAEARRIKKPICVLTRRGVWVADPSSKDPVTLLDDPAWTTN